MVSSVGIASLSSTPAPFRHRLSRGVAVLEGFGCSVELATNTWWDHGGSAGTPLERVQGLMSLVRAGCDTIVLSTGGSSAHEVLPLLPYRELRSSRVRIMGFSDDTSVLNAVHRRAGIPTFHGPTLLPHFGESRPDLAVLCFALSVINHPGRRIVLPSPSWAFTDEPDWVDSTRRRLITETTEPWSIGRRAFEGLLVGGNLETLARHPPGLPEGTDYALLLEDSGHASPDRLESWLRALLCRPFVRSVRGVLAAAYPRFGVARDAWSDLLRTLRSELGVTVVCGLGVGHGSTPLCLPIGGQATWCRARGVELSWHPPD